MFYDVAMTSHQLAGTGLHLPPIRVPAEGDESPSMARSKFIYNRDNGYREPSGHMDLVTNYQLQYTRKSVSPARPFKSDRAREEPSTRFEGSTTNSSDFRVWRYDSREKPLRHPNSIAPSAGKVIGPSHYNTEYGPPAGNLSSPVAPRRAIDGSSNFHRQVPYSQQQTSADHGLLMSRDPSPDRHPHSSDSLSIHQQATYGAGPNLRSSFPPPSNTTQPPDGLINATTGGGVSKTRRTGGDTDSSYHRDFTRKSIIKQAPYKPRGQTLLAASVDHPFENTTSHCEAFQRWKSERLQQAAATPAAGTSTGGGTGRQPPSQVTLTWTATSDLSPGSGPPRSDHPGRYSMIGRKPAAAERFVPSTAAGLPTASLDRTPMDFTGRRAGVPSAVNGRTADGSSETSTYRKDYADLAAAAIAQRNAVPAGIVTIPDADGLPIDLSGDLQTIYRRMKRHQPEDPVIARSGDDVKTGQPEVVVSTTSNGSQNDDNAMVSGISRESGNDVVAIVVAAADDKPEALKESVFEANAKGGDQVDSGVSAVRPEAKPFDERRVSIIDQSEPQAGQPRDIKQ